MARIIRRTSRVVSTADHDNAELGTLRAAIRRARERARLVERHDAHIVELAMAAAIRLVGAELSLAPERIRDIVDEVLDAAHTANRIVLHVHPEDVPTLRRRLNDERVLSIEGTPEVDRGDCVAITDCGAFDGRLQVRLAALERALLEPGENDRE